MRQPGSRPDNSSILDKLFGTLNAINKPFHKKRGENLMNGIIMNGKSYEYCRTVFKFFLYYKMQ
ncbi:hypothetical protein MTBBW1_340017 [Desulfamplus magnetovallimortis]|uniref:Uncharacterized protein n=1 Tax=Desulfamplus magnetovallimortis TaxID=1246637 RepID=A0A1W1HGE7_9BACT|nr:hypothetical protein MTBBW1_340017 [Desulfamplus magnetovallimortis]